MARKPTIITIVERGPAGPGINFDGDPGQIVGFDVNGDLAALDPSATSIPAGAEGQVLGYGPGGVPQAVDASESAALSDIPGALAAPYLQPAQLTQGAEIVSLPVGYSSQVDVRHFGAQMSAHDEFASDAVAAANLAALQDALNWSAEYGGMVSIPPGALDIFGTASLTLGAGLVGAGKHASQIRQRQIARGVGESYADMFAAPAVVGNTGGNGYNTIVNITLNGGWSLRDYEGIAGQVNWDHDPALMTQVGIALNTPSGGPSAYNAVRLNDDAPVAGDGGSDAHNRVQDVSIFRMAGTGILSEGRGEAMFLGLEMARCAITGMDLRSPDCWIDNMTSYTHGQDGIVIRAGASDLRMTNSKFWFCGMQRRSEPVGAGIHLPDQGTTSMQISNCSTQDTWGPGLALSGSYGVSFKGLVDEAGGGRLEQQGFGYQGARTQPRSFVRASGTLRRANVEAQIRGGDRNGASNRPVLAHLSGSAIMGSRFYFGGDLTGVSASRVNVSAGTTNAQRYNEVWFEDRLLHGYVTQAQLDDPAHGVNDPTYGPTKAIRDDGAAMVKSTGGDWIDQTALLLATADW